MIIFRKNKVDLHIPTVKKYIITLIGLICKQGLPMQAKKNVS